MGARDSPAQAPTVAFMTLALAQIAHLGNARSGEPVLRPARVVANPYALAGAFIAVGLQLGYGLDWTARGHSACDAARWQRLGRDCGSVGGARGRGPDAEDMAWPDVRALRPSGVKEARSAAMSRDSYLQAFLS